MGFTWENDIHLYSVLPARKSFRDVLGDATFHRGRRARLVDYAAIGLPDITKAPCATCWFCDAHERVDKGPEVNCFF